MSIGMEVVVAIECCKADIVILFFLESIASRIEGVHIAAAMVMVPLKVGVVVDKSKSKRCVMDGALSSSCHSKCACIKTVLPVHRMLIKPFAIGGDPNVVVVIAVQASLF